MIWQFVFTAAILCSLAVLTGIYIGIKAPDWVADDEHEMDEMEAEDRIKYS